MSAPDCGAWDKLSASLSSRLGGGSPAALRAALVTSEAAAQLSPDSVRSAGALAVRAHVEREATRAVIRRMYTPGDAALSRMGPQDLHTAPSLEEIHPRLFAGPLLSLDWCRRLVDELSRLRAWSEAHGIPPVAPNSMNRYGVMLDDLGMGTAMGWLTRDVIRPLAASRYADLGGADLEDPHAFLVEYHDKGDVHLDFHVDDSEVTLNLCLGESFSGGELYFEGLRCDAHLQTACSPADSFAYEHVPGHALLHAGKHRHGAHPIRGGRRVNLIVWCRSPATRAGDPTHACPAWCAESRAR